MSFSATTFTFDGKSSEEFDLYLFDIGSTEQEETAFAWDPEILEDVIPNRYRHIHYGAQQKDALSFKLVCCLSEERAIRREPLDRYELSRIAGWLIGHQQYKWLTIDQPDMDEVRYRCMISDLKVVEVFHEHWGLQFTVKCDSPYAYMRPSTQQLIVSDTGDIVVHNRSTANTYCYPTIQITGASSVEIANADDGGRVFAISDIPSGATVDVDCERCIITCSTGANLYRYCNFNFPRLVRGDNHLSISGSGTYRFTCEFPVNIGG